MEVAGALLLFAPLVHPVQPHLLEVGFGAGVLPQPGLLPAPMPAASLALPPRVSSLTLAASSR